MTKTEIKKWFAAHGYVLKLKKRTVVYERYLKANNPRIEKLFEVAYSSRPYHYSFLLELIEKNS